MGVAGGISAFCASDTGRYSPVARHASHRRPLRLCELWRRRFEHRRPLPRCERRRRCFQQRRMITSELIELDSLLPKCFQFTKENSEAGVLVTTTRRHLRTSFAQESQKMCLHFWFENQQMITFQLWKLWNVWNVREMWTTWRCLPVAVPLLKFEQSHAFSRRCP